MTEPKFTIGQTVTVVRRRYDTRPSGRFRIVRALPAEGRMRQYRVQSVADGHERVVSEAELA